MWKAIIYEKKKINNIALMVVATLGVNLGTMINVHAEGGNTNSSSQFIQENIEEESEETVDEYASSKESDSISNINAGQGSLKDYKILGIKGVTVENIPYINSSLKGKQLFEVSRIQEEVDRILLGNN